MRIMTPLQVSTTRDAVALLMAAVDGDVRATTVLVADKSVGDLRHLVAFLAQYATSLLEVQGGDVNAVRSQLARVALSLS